MCVITFLFLSGRNSEANECLPDTELAPMTHPEAAAGDEFGTSISVDGYNVIVGSNLDDVGGADSGRAYITDARDGSLIATLSNPSPGAGDWFGWSVGISGDRAVVGARFDDTSANNAGRAYLFDSETGTLVTHLPNPAPSAGDEFGFSAAISGNRAVVGAPSEDPGGVNNAGRAYVFDVNTGALTATLAHPAPAANDFFGYSVAVSGGLAVVGAYLKDATGATDSGRAYVFNVNTGALVSTLTHPTPSVGDQFGWSVGISGTMAIVGAYREDIGGANDAGAAYVFNANTGMLLSTLTAPAPVAGSLLGFAVSLDGTLALVGAPVAPGPAGSAGAMLLFEAASGVFLSRVDSPGPSSGAQFGYAVSLSGNLAAVGAPKEDGGGTDIGSARTYSCADPCNADEPAGILTHPVPGVFDAFGTSVAVNIGIVVVGAPLDDNVLGNVGSAFAWDAATGAFLAEFVNPSPVTNESFGTAVGISGTTVLVGAPNNDTGGSDAGVVRVYDALTGSILTTLLNPSPDLQDHFGKTLGISGGLAVVGAPDDDTAGLGTGAAHIFTVPGGTFVRSLFSPVPGLTDQFGASVAICANLVVIGAPFDDDEGSNSGRAFVFDALTGTLLSTLITPAPAPAAGDLFGSAVSISGRLALVGSPNEDTGASNAGSAWLFDARTGAFLVGFSNPAPNSNDGFGATLSIFNNVAAIGASQNDEGGTNAGAAYAFDAVTGSLLFSILNPSPANADQFGGSVALSAEILVLGSQGDWGGSPPVNSSGTVHLYTCPGATCCPGDANNSGGSVNANDFLTVQSNFGTDNGLGGLGDANCSGGAVNANDFLTVQANFGANCD